MIWVLFRLLSVTFRNCIEKLRIVLKSKIQYFSQFFSLLNESLEIELEWRVLLNLAYIVINVNSDSPKILEDLEGNLETV